MDGKEKVGALMRALRKLKEGQGRIARRNARRAVAARLRSIHQMMDEAFPPIAGVPRKLSSDPKARENRMVKQGWVPIPLAYEHGVLAACAQAGVRPRRFSVTGDGQWWVRQWVLDAWHAAPKDKEASTLRKLARDRKARTMFRVTHALTKE